MPESLPAPALHETPTPSPRSEEDAVNGIATDSGPAAPLTAQTLRANLARILKAYRGGPLPEERSDLTTASWPWSSPTKVAEPASGKEAKRRGRRSTEEKEAASDASLADARRRQPFAELVSLEREAAFILGGGDLNGVAKLTRDVTAWFERRLSAEGLLPLEPALTWSVFGSVDRLRLALRDAGWNESLEARWRGFVENVIRTAALPDHGLRAALSGAMRTRLADALKDKALKAWRGPLDSLFGEPASKGAGKPPAVAGVQSDDSAFAILRRDWSVGAAVVRINHAERTPDLGFHLGGQPIFAGPWETEIRIDGKPLPAMGRWDPTCWFADEDSEYLELRRLTGSGLVLERQLFLSKRASLLLLADTVKTPLAEPVELSWSLPAGGSPAMGPAANGAISSQATGSPGSMVASPPLTAKRWSVSGHDLRLMIPTLPADPLAPVPANRHRLERGSIRLEGSRLVVSASGRGKRLFLPLVLDWSPASAGQPAPWSTMLVTSDRMPVPPNDGVAFRVPTGTGQMVYHRTFGPRGRFAFLGYQTRHECTIVELRPDGKFKEWLLVD